MRFPSAYLEIKIVLSIVFGGSLSRGRTDYWRRRFLVVLRSFLREGYNFDDKKRHSEERARPKIVRLGPRTPATSAAPVVTQPFISTAL